MSLPEKKTYLYQERNEKDRAEFMEKLKGYGQERLVYVDEAGIDDTIDYPYGYCHKSQRYVAEKLGHRKKRISVVSGWRQGERIAPMRFEGYCNSQVICKWVKEFLVPELIPGQIVLIDNASFHPQARIEKLVSQARCEVIFLPTYSPDLNKIEHFWERLKKEVGKLKNQCESLYDAIIEALS